MMDALADGARLALENLTTPMVLFFGLGMAAGLARSDLTVPEPVAKVMSLYLMMSIGLRGGGEVAGHGVSAHLVAVAASGVLLSFGIPFLAFAVIRILTGLDRANAGAVAAHYGSISIVTYVAANESLSARGLAGSGVMVAVVALMETPAIVSGLMLARGGSPSREPGSPLISRKLLREILLNGSVVLLVGSFVIGILGGTKGLETVEPFIIAPFKGVLCLFLLDLGLLAARRLSAGNRPPRALLALGLILPPIHGSLGLLAAWLLGLPLGDGFLLTVLAASASYIAVPAAMRLAVPEANPANYLTLSLALTFPFNITLGIPLYFAAARAVLGG